MSIIVAVGSVQVLGVSEVVLIELADGTGILGLGEQGPASPSTPRMTLSHTMTCISTLPRGCRQQLRAESIMKRTM